MWRGAYLEVDREVKDEGPESHSHKDVDAEKCDNVPVLPEVRGHNGLIRMLGLDIEKTANGRDSKNI